MRKKIDNSVAPLPPYILGNRFEGGLQYTRPGLLHFRRSTTNMLENV